MPWWFQTLASVLAVVMSVWTGMHYGMEHAAYWMGAYGAAALVSAWLGAHRYVGLVGLAVAGGLGAIGTYLLADVFGTISLAHPWQAREVIGFVLTLAWLAPASVYRLIRT